MTLIIQPLQNATYKVWAAFFDFIGVSMSILTNMAVVSYGIRNCGFQWHFFVLALVVPLLPLLTPLWFYLRTSNLVETAHRQFRYSYLPPYFSLAQQARPDSPFAGAPHACMHWPQKHSFAAVVVSASSIAQRQTKTSGTIS